MIRSMAILTTLFSVLATLFLVACAEDITDKRDEKKYRIVQIGVQTWMAQNLNIHYPQFPLGTFSRHSIYPC